jgi:uncharacterized protein (TIGR02246 family)
MDDSVQRVRHVRDLRIEAAQSGIAHLRPDPGKELRMGKPDSEIQELLRAWKTAIAAGDLETISNLVTEDAEFWSNGQAPIIGRQALKAAFAPIVAAYTMNQDFLTDELVVAGECAFMRGLEVNELVSRETGDKTTLRQRAFSIMRRCADGRWRFSRGMTNQPPEAG